MWRLAYKVDFQTPLEATGEQGLAVELSSFTLQLPVWGRERREWAGGLLLN